MQRKPEQMHVKPAVSDPVPQEENTNPTFTAKEVARLQGMKWFQEQGLQYDSSRDDGQYLHLCSSHPRP